MIVTSANIYKIGECGKFMRVFIPVLRAQTFLRYRRHRARQYQNGGLPEEIAVKSLAD